MHVHILGVAGTFMAGIAAIAREAGHRVSGSDRGVYPPMSDQLAALGVTVTEGYAAGQLDPRPDVVIVGNVMSRGVPVVEELLDRGIPYCSGPEWLAREVLRHRWVVAVSGTHGKTTTTSMVAWLLSEAGFDPGYLIGGVALNFPSSARLGRGRHFVIEADEYDTAFFDKGAKFLHYRPRTLVVNNLEYDHADIYPDLAAIQRQFHQLVRMVPGNGLIAAHEGDGAVRAVLDMGCWTPVAGFGSDPSAEGLQAVSRRGRLTLYEHGRELGSTAWSLAGAHNAENAAAAVLAARHAGVDLSTALRALGTFRGVKRRLELLGDFSGVRVYDDFAHHPTAIRRTLATLREEFPDARVLAVIEPRSNTMKLGVHRDSLAGAVAAADSSWLLQPAGLPWDLRAALAPAASARVCDDTASIIAGVVAAARPGDAVVIMSNGDFHNLRVDLPRALAGRRPGT